MADITDIKNRVSAVDYSLCIGDGFMFTYPFGYVSSVDIIDYMNDTILRVSFHDAPPVMVSMEDEPAIAEIQDAYMRISFSKGFELLFVAA